MKNLIKFSLVAVLATSSVMGSGIPVVDGALNSQVMTQNFKQIAEWIKEAKRWVDTTKHYTSQLNAYAEELATKTGIRDITSVLEDVREIYGSGMELYDTVNSLNKNDLKDIGKNKLNTIAKDLMIETLGANPCEKVSKDLVAICEEDNMANFKETIFFANAGESINEATKNIEKLIKKLEKSKDIKESADINNAINSQIALIETQKAQIDMAMYQRQIQKDIREQKINAESAKMWGSF